MLQIFAILKIIGGLKKSDLAYFAQQSQFKSETLKKFPKFKRDKKTIEGWFAHFNDSKNAFDLVMELLELVPDKRVSAAEALEHPFFASVKEQCRLDK